MTDKMHRNAYVRMGALRYVSVLDETTTLQFDDILEKVNADFTVDYHNGVSFYCGDLTKAPSIKETKAAIIAALKFLLA